MRDEQQNGFEEMKRKLQELQILHCNFHLYSDTSKFATGSAHFQIQIGKLILRAYASKWMPETAKYYFITELELCGLAINIESFAHLLKKIDTDAIVDH